jgi:uncharacterized protein YfdQ (DUF2303 family)
MSDRLIDFCELATFVLAGTEHMDKNTIMIPKEMDLRSLSPFADTPSLHTGTFNTDDIDAFCVYMKANSAAGNNPHCFISVGEAVRATLILDFGSPENPEWREHLAVLSPANSPAFAALLSLCSRPQGQDDLLDFFDDWSQVIGFERADGGQMQFPAARAEFADLTVEKMRAIKAKKADYDRAVSATERLTMQASLPNRMVMTCSPWVGLSTRKITVRLQAVEHGGGVAIKPTLVALDALRDELASELCGSIRNASDLVTVLRGDYIIPDRASAR